MTQKERQLQDMRKEFAIQQEEMSKKSKLDVERIQQVLDDERNHFESELKRHKKMLQQRDTDVQELDMRLHNLSSRLETNKPSVNLVDFSQQFGERKDSVDEYEHLIDVILSQLGKLFVDEDLSIDKSSASCTTRVKRIVEEAANFVSTSKSLIEKSKEGLEIKNKKIKMLETEIASLNNAQDGFGNELSHNLSTLRSDLEMKHKDHLLSIQSEHKSEMDSLKADFRKQVAAMEKKVKLPEKGDMSILDYNINRQNHGRSSSSNTRYPPLLSTVKELEEHYPLLVKSLKNTLVSQHQNHLNELEAQYQDNLIENEKRWDQKYSTIKNEFNKITTQYQNSLKKLKEDGILLHGRMKAEMDSWISNLKQQHKKELEEKLSKNDHRNDSLKHEVLISPLIYLFYFYRRP